MTMKLTEVPTQRFIDNITSITPGVLKGGLTTIDRRPMLMQTMAKVSPDTPGAPPKVYDELLVGGSDGVPRIYKMHREVKRVIGDDANKVREFAEMPGRIFAGRFNSRRQPLRRRQQPRRARARCACIRRDYPRKSTPGRWP